MKIRSSEFEKLTGKMAFSKAGHDKGRLYVVVGEDAEFVYLCDGRLRLKEHPKKKKRMHIQPVKILPSDVEKMLNDMESVDDADLRRVVRRMKEEMHHNG